ncbi:fumarylacetoacetate hydrolase family protein [Glaciecola sp. 2405UD65-10]|uniref:fumarylacetoacetate hydrolase family protein n=1 Tax=Glaciecola sp. 2405UD65-10 TaxID=3397244 RepID=UPI003B5922AD
MNTVNFEKLVVTPSKVVCIGRNYADHIAELNNEVPSEPVIFLKPNSAISSKLYTHKLDEIHYETEISLLVKDKQYCGIALGLDLTKRGIQSMLKAKGLPWERAKSFDRSAVFTPFLPMPDDIRDVSLRLTINGELKQEGGVELMLHKPKAILSEIQTFMSVEDGDIIMTGTPKGVGVVNAGDIFEVALFNGAECLLEHSWKAELSE